MPALICCNPATLGQSWENPYWGFPPWGLKAAFKVRAWYGLPVPSLAPGCLNLLAWFSSLATALAHHQNMSENHSTVRWPQLPPADLSLLYLTPAPWGEKNQTCNKNQTALSWKRHRPCTAWGRCSSPCSAEKTIQKKRENKNGRFSPCLEESKSHSLSARRSTENKRLNPEGLIKTLCLKGCQSRFKKKKKKRQAVL